MLLVACQLSRDVIGYKTRNQQLVRFDPSIVTVKQHTIRDSHFHAR